MEFSYKHPETSNPVGQSRVRFEAADFEKRKKFEENLPKYAEAILLLASDDDSYVFEGIHQHRVFHRIIRGEPLEQPRLTGVETGQVYPLGTEKIDAPKYL